MARRSTPPGNPRPQQPTATSEPSAALWYGGRLAPRRKFFQRLGASFLLVLVLVAVSLVIGMLGYRFLAGFAWIDAFLNAAMVLSGMGEVDSLAGTPAKLFAGLYALYCGLALVAIAGLILAPILHRFLRRFHLEDEREEG